MIKSNFDKMVNIFSKVYEKILDSEVLSIYFDLLKEIPDSQVNYIIRECLKKCHYFPRPANIFEYYDEYSGEIRRSRKTSPEELEISKRVIRKVRQEFERIKEPAKVGDILKDLKIEKEK